MTSEPECIAQGNVDGAVLCFIEGHIQPGIEFVIVGEVIDCRRYDRLVDGKQAGDGLDGAGGSEEVARHGLRRADVHLVGVVAEDALDRLDLPDITQGS